MNVDTADLINQEMCERKCIKLTNPSRKTNDEYEEEWALMENKSNYTGTVKNMMPNGFGKEFRNEYCYMGYFVDGKWHGKGMIKITIPEDKETSGEFIDGYFCGI